MSNAQNADLGQPAIRVVGQFWWVCSTCHDRSDPQTSAEIAHSLAITHAAWHGRHSRTGSSFYALDLSALDLSTDEYKTKMAQVLRLVDHDGSVTPAPHDRRRGLGSSRFMCSCGHHVVVHPMEQTGGGDFTAVCRVCDCLDYDGEGLPPNDSDVLP